MSKLSNDKKEESNSEMIPENMLYEIFETQYDDLFCKILKISEQSFKYFLQQQVLFNLLIIQKKYDQSIISAFQELFIKRYKENFKTMKKNFELLKSKENNKSEDLTYLDFTKCYIHCHKCYSIVHKCGSKLILYDSNVYCIKCNNVYNKNQIMLYCPECNKNYFTKLRKPVINNNKKFEKLFIIKYKDYHCPTEKEEKIKCLKCSNNLYYRLIINNPKNEESINTIYCIKCKLKYNLKDVFFKCKICLNNFKCQAKIYRDFPNKKKKLLFIIHTLLRNKKALPNINLCNKKCKCDIKNVTEYTHNDNGILLEGVKNNKKEVICKKCFQIFDYNEFDWKCPECGDIFKHKIINTSKNKSLKSNNTNNNKIKIDKIGKNKMKKIPVFKINININNINRDKEPELNDYIIKTEASENRVIKSKIVEKKNSSINVDKSNNHEKLKKIFTSKNLQNNGSDRFIMVRSKSKSEMARNKDKVEKINSIYKKEKDKEKTSTINIIKKNNNYIDVNSIVKNKISNSEKKNENINEENSPKINPKQNVNHENKTIDTTKIFNNIKNNIFNIDENYSNLNYPKEEKKRIRVSNKLINPKYQSAKNEDIIVEPKEKNSINFNGQELNLNLEGNNNIYKYNTSGDFSNYNNINENNMVNSRKLDSIENYQSIQMIEDKKKPKINYAKKIYLFNNKIERDNRSYDQNVNFKKIKINNLFTKYEGNRKNKINSNIINYNNFYNNNYLFNNINSMNYQNNSNYNNFYLNYENYGMNNQQINLYNFNSQNYSIIKVLGKGSNGKIYLVQDMQTQQRFALKSMLIDNEMDLKEKEEQYNLIYRLTYENPELKIVNIYGLEVRKVDKFNTFLNVLMEKGEYDWETEISRRIKTKNYYTEDELFYILSNLVATFAILQQKGISHRDVKPQNILCFGNNEYKICDFGEAKYKDRMKYGNNFNNLDSSNQTIRGTEMYMSPILFRAVKSRPDSLTKYNSFKSDVFSLGLCFLYAGSLDLNILFKVRDILNMQKIGIIVNQYLGRLYSQEFIGLLLYMLQVDEKYRPDFIELNSWIVYGNY